MKTGHQPTTQQPSGPDDSAIETLSLSAKLKSHTRQQHRRAERSGVIQAITSHTITPSVYCRYLGNLYPVYAMLEQRLQAVADSTDLEPLTTSAIARAPAIRCDLDAICDVAPLSNVNPVPACLRYVDDIASASLAGLIGHAYVRYLGDLNGGAVLRRCLQRTLELQESELAFYRFPAIVDTGEHADRVRIAIDRTPAVDHDEVLRTATRAFELNITMANETLALASDSGSPQQPR
jgi:heme oxygenase